MTNPPPDWDKEPADGDKAVARQPGVPPRPLPPAGGTPVPARTTIMLTWFLTGLGIVLAVALPLWPYENSCGAQLMFYLGAVGLTALIGVWGATTSWRARRGIAHCLSLLTVVWAAVLLAGAVLPRTGYAKHEQTWLCP